MRTLLRTLAVAWLLAVATPAQTDGSAKEAAKALDDFHAAAAKADGAAYFAFFAPEGVFIGTDATERWTVEQFKAFAEPYFSKGRGWVYTAKARQVQFTPAGDFAWFDEMLDNETYGLCRGTGVLRRIEGEWKICQYHLTIPVPNALAKQFVHMIRELEKAENGSGKNP